MKGAAKTLSKLAIEASTREQTTKLSREKTKNPKFLKIF